MNEGLRKRALADAEAGRFPQAVEAYREIVRADPQDAQALRQLADVAKKAGSREHAAQALSVLADLYAADGLVLRSVAACRELLDFDPEGAETRLTRIANLRLGEPVRTQVPRPSNPPPAPPGRAAIQKLITPSDRPAPAPSGATRIPLFSDLPEEAFLELVTRMPKKSYSLGELIIREGESDGSAYALVSGRVRVEKKRLTGAPQVLAHLREGSIFGEMALLSDAPRTASVICEEPVEVFVIDRTLLEELSARHPNVPKVLRAFHRQRMLATLLSTHRFFAPLSDAERDRLRGAFKSKAFEAGELVFAEGSPGTGLYLVLSGELKVTRGDAEVARLRPGDVFGERSLLFERPTSASVTAVVDAVALRLDKQVFREVIEATPELEEMLRKLSEDRSR